MNKIQQLIQQYCPNGVEIKELGEVCLSVNAGGDLPENYKKGQVLPSNEFPYPIYSNGCDDNALYGFTDKYKIDSDAVTISARGTIGYHAIREAKYTPIVRLISLIPNKELITTKFLNYILDMTPIGGTNGGIPQLTVPTVKKISIPIPPLPIQQEIVTILNTFTALDGSLQAELEARRKQYEHYRNQLLNFEGKEVEWKTLGEIGEFVRGTGLQKTDFVEKGVGCIHYGQIYTYYDTFIYKTKSFVSEDLAIKLKKVNKGDLIITTTSENLEDVCTTIAWLGDEEIVTGAHASIFRHNQNAKYLAYYFQTDDIFNQKKRYAKGTKVIEIKANEIGKFKIPIPPLSEQERIVSILDKFDTLVNNELPSEIAARRKQYEYYREKLLDFKTLQS